MPTITGNKLKNRAKSGFRLVAIDPATVSGWANGSSCGIWDLTRKRDESVGIMLLRFRSFLDELVKLTNATIVAYEKPGGRNYSAVVLHSKFVGEIEKYCTENNIEYRGCSAAEVKKFATGKGNCGKPEMIEAAKVKLGYKGNNDNEADALWIYEFVKNELSI